ncbi:fatty acyl-AMP ligase [Pseudomonas sp. zfem002]|uniref:fatty acyl-AMP ligase n=1 Tax=Pseudomonas sp. zfem002 TaxID=3078197 RepID=UPI00292A13B3|nr:fatty acyl-AMP ligase [Pseudomonas sp. zfem002]MDU9392280.1 fatty acyl-AMP ligase [Pseudomonas sp. zfem002]
MFDKTGLTPQEVLTASGQLAIHDCLALRARLHPHKVLFTLLDDDGEEQQRLTYAELFGRVGAIARQLREHSAPGDRIALFFPQGLEFIASFLACLDSGRIAVPVNLPNRRRIERCLSILEDSDSRLLLVADSERDALQQAFAGSFAAQLPMLAPTPASAAEVPWVRPDDSEPQRIAFLQYTSGSTSAPKGVMVSHANISANLRMMRDAWALDQDSDFVTWQPHHHDMGLILGQLLPIVLGNHTVIMAPSTFVRQPLLWLQAIARYKARLAGGPNFAYNLAVERYDAQRLAGLDLSHWTHALNGADVVRSASLSRFAECYGAHGFAASSFLPCYGLAEATLFVAGGPHGQPVRTLQADAGVLAAEQRLAFPTDAAQVQELVGCGEPSWEVQIATVDPTSLQRCAPGRIGEIWLRGPAIAQGYWRNDEATATAFHARITDEPGHTWLRTGDLGFVEEQDRQLYVCGRLKDLIICEGRNLHPEDIEHRVLEALREVRAQSCAVFSHDNEQQRQLIVAAIELNRELKRWLQDDPRQLKALVRGAVADSHGITLNRIVFVLPTSIHKTTSGKIQRGRMRQLYLTGQLELVDGE